MNRVFRHPVTRRIRAGQQVLGGWLQLGSPISAEIMSASGFECLVVDMEHGSTSMSNLVPVLQALDVSRVLPIVRAPWNDFVLTKLILDSGAYGMLFPYVNTKEEAEQAIAACMYPPDGIRGMAGSVRAMGFGQNVKNYAPYANEEIFIWTQCETMESVENLDEILSIPRLDGLFIGPADLSTNMGYMGDSTKPEVQKVIREIESKVFAAGKAIGTVAPNYAAGKMLYERGYHFVSVMGDATGLANAAVTCAKAFQEDFGAKNKSSE